MRFLSSSATHNSLYHDALGLLGIPETDTTVFPTAVFTRYSNAWYQRFVYYIWKNSGKWQFVDKSATSGLPEATDTLVDGQGTYTIPTTAIDILEVWAKNNSGDYRKLDKINPIEIIGARDEYGESSGMPSEYYMSGEKIVLKPKPGAAYITTTSGLKLVLDSTPTLFTIADTIKEPGFLATFHRLISLGAAFDFARAHNMTLKINFIKPDLDKMIQEMEEYYSKRSRGDKGHIKPSTISSI